MSDITVEAASTGRTAYRVVPDPDDPIILQIDGHLSRVLDISATGFSAPPDVVEYGRRYPFSMDLPSSHKPIAGYVDVLKVADREQLHCKFVNLGPEELDALHHYVLVRQREAIRSLRGPRGTTSD